MTAFLVINLTVAVFWFFKASAWSVRQSAQRTTRPEPASSLRERLLALNQQNVPGAGKCWPRSRNNVVDVTWRYGDAQWFDLMRAHKMRRTHKLVLWLG